VSVIQPNRNEIQRALGLNNEAATTLEEMVVARGGRRAFMVKRIDGSSRAEG